MEKYIYDNSNGTEDKTIHRRLVEEGDNKRLKEQDQLAWVRAMNNIRNRTEESVLKELIFAE